MIVKFIADNHYLASNPAFPEKTKNSKIEFLNLKTQGNEFEFYPQEKTFYNFSFLPEFSRLVFKKRFSIDSLLYIVQKVTARNYFYLIE
jgi:hypothetical protein